MTSPFDRRLFHLFFGVVIISYHQLPEFSEKLSAASPSALATSELLWCGDRSFLS
jgi:hypothetical protein